MTQKEKRDSRVASGLCETCGKSPISDQTRKCYLCRSKSVQWYKKYNDANPDKRKKWRDNQRDIVFKHYGGHCSCCGESHREFLTIDHINNDGNIHRQQIGRGGAIVSWLIRNNFPPGFQVLCYNCNCAKSFAGGCPHLRDRVEEAA